VVRGAQAHLEAPRPGGGRRGGPGGADQHGRLLPPAVAAERDLALAEAAELRRVRTAEEKAETEVRVLQEAERGLNPQELPAGALPPEMLPGDLDGGGAKD